MTRFALVLFLSVFSAETFAQTLNDTEVLYRCYGHLTSKRLQKSNPLLQLVESGKINGVEACDQILSSAKLKSNGRFTSDSRDARSVLDTMTKLHLSFFKNQALVDVSNSFTRVSKDIYDEQSSALHFTKALFTTGHGVDDILKAKKDIEGLRTNPLATTRGPSSNARAGIFTRTGPSRTKVRLTPNFVTTGQLTGLRDARAFNVPMSVGSEGHGTDIRSTIGGGLLGTRAYLKRSASSQNPTTNYNGALSMNRVWANTVLEDFLCKSLPAVRLADGQPYKKQDATAPFRKTDGCIQCHATMDQLAAGGRNLLAANLTRDNGNTSTNPQLRYAYNRKPDRPTAEMWPTKTDRDYFRRPANGRLYFRSFSGELINKSFSNFDQLADKILETDDYYSCIAKKYYKHFTGVNASLADINDPFSNIVLNEQDLYHRKKVIELGQELKLTKDPEALIKSIFRSDVYNQKGYTILGVN